MSNKAEIDIADKVYHQPSDEHWIVAYVEGNDVYWCGYPFGGFGSIDDCTLVEKASEGERLELMQSISSGRSENSAQKSLRSKVKRRLEELTNPKPRPDKKGRGKLSIIYLQDGGGSAHGSGVEITWCKDRIEDDDTAYVQIPKEIDEARVSQPQSIDYMAELYKLIENSKDEYQDLIQAVDRAIQRSVFNTATRNFEVQGDDMSLLRTIVNDYTKEG